MDRIIMSKVKRCSHVQIIMMMTLFVLYMFGFGYIYNGFFFKDCCSLDNFFRSSGYADRRLDKWREFVTRDTYMYSVHVIKNLARFVICDLLVNRKPVAYCCYFDSNDTLLLNDSEFQVQYFRIPEFRLNQRQVWYICLCR